MLIPTTLVLLALAIVSVAFLYLGVKGYKWYHTFMIIMGFIMTCTFVFAISIYFAVSFSWFAAEYQADILNREYGTQYTQTEMFYAKNVIDTVRELDRKRIELNGNLLNNKACNIED